jgi:chromosomal replication initiation ATPase DnaA
LDAVAESVACHYHCLVNELTTCTKYKSKNEKRQVAMHLCQEIAGAKLVTIAEYFNLTAIGSVSSATHQIRKKWRNDQEFNRKVVGIIQLFLKKST